LSSCLGMDGAFQNYSLLFIFHAFINAIIKNVGRCSD
jgi:hypothetical protein